MRVATIASIIAVALGMAGSARADFSQLTSASQLSASDVTATYPGADDTRVNSPVVVATGGNTLTISDTPAVGFLRVNQGPNWTGGFVAGTTLLWNIDSTGSVYGGPDTIAFATGVTEAGFLVQQDDPANTTFTATVYEGTTAKLTSTVLVTPGTGGGNLGFIGFAATNGDVITSIVLSSVDASDATYDNDFVIAPVSFSPLSSVPEPSTVALTVVGLASAGGLTLFRRRSPRGSGGRL